MKHGYSVLFGGLLAQHLGLPIPAALLMVAAGALVAVGKMGIVTVLVVAIPACVVGDWAWYEAGRREGDRILHFIHRLTRDPETHDEKAKTTFNRYSPALLIFAEFVPALNAVIAPLAGSSRVTRVRFLLFDGLGAGLYSCTYLTLGYAFSSDLDQLAAYVSRAGAAFAFCVLAILSILGGHYLLRFGRLTYQFDRHANHDLIGLNLNRPIQLPVARSQ